MAGTDLGNHGRVLIGAEATYNVDVIDHATNTAVALRYLDCRAYPTFTPIEEFVETPRSRGSASTEGHVHLPFGTGLAIQTPLAGAVAVGTTEYPDIAPLLKACGLKETLSSGVSATYSVSTHQEGSASIYAYQTALQLPNLQRMNAAFGARGNLTIAGDLRAEAMCDFTMESPTYRDNVTSDNANWQFVSDEKAFFDAGTGPALDILGDAVIFTGSESYADSPKMIVSSVTLTVDSQAVRCSSFKVNLNRAIKRIEAVTGAGIVEVLSLFGAPTIDLVVEESGAGFEKLLTKMVAETEIDCTIVLSRGSALDKITINAPACQVRGLAPSDNGGTVAWSTQLVCRGNYSGSINGDNDLTIVWAQAA